MGARLLQLNNELRINRLVISNIDQIDPQVRDKVIKELGTKRTEALQNGDYLLAERCVLCSRQLVELENTDRYEEIQNQKADEVYNKYSIAQEEFQKTKDERDSLIVERAKNEELNL